MLDLGPIGFPLVIGAVVPVVTPDAEVFLGLFLGDEIARTRVLEEVYEPLATAGGDLLVTAAAYLDAGGSLEATDTYTSASHRY